MLLRLRSTADFPAWLGALVGAELSLHSMEVVNRLTLEKALPAQAVHLYIYNCIQSCEGAKVSSERQPWSAQSWSTRAVESCQQPVRCMSHEHQDNPSIASWGAGRSNCCGSVGLVLLGSCCTTSQCCPL